MANRQLPDWADFVSRETLFVNAIRLRHFIWTIERHVPLPATILEAGFGSGTTAVLLADMGYRVTAVDLNQDLVRRVTERYEPWVRGGRLAVQQADMFQLPWDSPTFDLAYHQGVLEHFPDEQVVAALQQQCRVAKRVIFDVPNSRYDSQPYGDERLLPISHWRRLIQSAGLRVREVVGRSFRPWTVLLPYALFSHRGVARLPGVSSALSCVSIFVCEPA